MTLDEKIIRFRDSLQQFPAEYADAVLYQSKKDVTFIINPFKKTSIDSDMKMAGYSVVISDAPFMFKISDPSVKTEEFVRRAFDNGEIYFMEQSSVLSPLALDIKQGKVLDMCGAPGGKTYYLQALTGNKLEVHLIDNNKNRLIKTQNNLQNLGVTNITTYYADSSKFSLIQPRFNNYFDAVLLDAPCSNESKIRVNEPESIKYWNPKLPSKLSKLQKKMLFEASKLVKVGGEIVYSTCTFNELENEAVVKWALEKNNNLELVDIHYSNPVPTLKLEGQLAKCKRIIPNSVYTGFFVAKILRKN